MSQQDGSILDELGALEKGLGKVDKALTKLLTNVTKMTTGLSGGARKSGFSAGTGTIGLGSSGNNFMDGSLGNVAPFLAMNRVMNTGFAVASGVTQAAAGIAGGLFAGMPNVAQTIDMSTMLYDAARIQGGPSWNSIGNKTLGLMGAGVSAPGSQGQVASMLSNMGVRYGTTQYNSLAKSVGNAYNYFGMDNATATQALGSFTQGSTSMSLMQNLGIYTTDPMSGKRATPTQMFAMINDRLTGGTSMNHKELMDSLQGGFMAENIRALGLDPGAEQMLKEYMLQASQGNYLNLEDPKTMKKYADQLGGNPLAPQGVANAAISGSMQAASTSYVEGMKLAADAVKQFEKVMTNFLNTPAGKAMAQANGGINLAGQDPAMQGLTTAVGGIVSGATTIGATVLGAKALKGILSKGAPSAVAAVGKNATSVLGKVGKIGGPVLAAGLGAVQLASDVASGQGWGSKQFSQDMGSTVGGILGGIAGSFVSPFLGTAVGATIGSSIGGQIGAAFGQGGLTTTVNGGGMTDTKATLKLVAPVKGPVTTRYNQTTDKHGNKLWGGDAHQAIDYGVPEGTPVQAAADGTVLNIGKGSGGRSYGNYIEIDHGNGYSTLYAHLKDGGIKVQKGQTVAQGQVIALSGATGYVTAAHLHFEARKNGAKINPENLGLGAAIGVVAGNATPTASNSASGTYSSSAQTSVGAIGSRSLETGNVGGNIAVPSSYKGASYGKVQGSMASGSAGSSMGGGSTPAGSTSGQGGPGLVLPGSRGGNNVTINLKIASASDSEARKFAKLVKEVLEEDKVIESMGRY